MWWNKPSLAMLGLQMRLLVNILAFVFPIQNLAMHLTVQLVLRESAVHHCHPCGTPNGIPSSFVTLENNHVGS